MTVVIDGVEYEPKEKAKDIEVGDIVTITDVNMSMRCWLGFFERYYRDFEIAARYAYLEEPEINEDAKVIHEQKIGNDGRLCVYVVKSTGTGKVYLMAGGIKKA